MFPNRLACVCYSSKVSHSFTESGSVYCIGNILEVGDRLHLLHEVNSDTGPVNSLHAGLHYVVACCQGDVECSMIFMS